MNPREIKTIGDGYERFLLRQSWLPVSGRELAGLRPTFRKNSGDDAVASLVERYEMSLRLDGIAPAALDDDARVPNRGAGPLIQQHCMQMLLELRESMSEENPSADKREARYYQFGFVRGALWAMHQRPDRAFGACLGLVELMRSDSERGERENTLFTLGFIPSCIWATGTLSIAELREFYAYKQDAT